MVDPDVTPPLPAALTQLIRRYIYSYANSLAVSSGSALGPIGLIGPAGAERL